mmetsp:Transcript_3315/g.7336  ORF Transcript_3315/g.7336 Transcript_3315/m.7336 type:complete len:276 (+) Transcript_3315:1158-1985(+)
MSLNKISDSLALAFSALAMQIHPLKVDELQLRHPANRTPHGRRGHAGSRRPSAAELQLRQLRQGWEQRRQQHHDLLVGWPHLKSGQMLEHNVLAKVVFPGKEFVDAWCTPGNQGVIDKPSLKLNLVLMRLPQRHLAGAKEDPWWDQHAVLLRCCNAELGERASIEPIAPIVMLFEAGGENLCRMDSALVDGIFEELGHIVWLQPPNPWARRHQDLTRVGQQPIHLWAVLRLCLLHEGLHRDQDLLRGQLVLGLRVFELKCSAHEAELRQMTPGCR